MRLSLNVFLLGLVVVSGAVSAEEMDPKKYTIVSHTVTEIKAPAVNKSRNYYQYKDIEETVDPVEKTGRVIEIARDLIALGEDVYTLIIKGKPTTATTYAPISVVPRMGDEPIDPLEMEGWSMPAKKTYEIRFKNAYKVDVVIFRYSVMFSYNGSYNNKGAYLTGVQIVPEYVRTLFGFDFTATMKLGGVQNINKKAAPVAGATLLMEYTVSSVMNKINKTDTYFVTGLGQLKKY